MELIKQERYDELWKACCGFMELPRSDKCNAETAAYEQIELLKHSELGRKNI
jgi:hypothetical protein